MVPSAPGLSRTSIHGGRPPKPSPFPTIVLILLSGGAFAANVSWRAEPTWLAPTVTAVGLWTALAIFRLRSCFKTSEESGLRRR